MPQTQLSEQKGNPESIFDSSFPPKAAWPALNPKWFDGSPAPSPLTGKHNRQFQAMRKILRIPRNWRPQNRELERRVNSAVAGEFFKRKRERRRKEKRKKRRKCLKEKLVGRLKGGEADVRLWVDGTAGTGSFTPAWEMLRVLRSDPSPRHKNADTWLREDTRGWGPPR